MKDFLKQKLKAIQKADWTRTLKTQTPLSATQRQIEDQVLIQFCSNDYLGLSQDKRLALAGYKASLKFGSGATGSRLITGTTILHTQLETELAKLKKQEASLFFSSGYSANIACLVALMGSGDIIYSDKYNHSSLILAAKASGATIYEYNHLDYQNLNTQIKAKRQQYRNALIVTDLVFSMDGDIANVNALAEIAEKNNCWLMLDEAHSTGLNDIDYNVENLIRMGTCSKALGLEGGFIAGSHQLIEYLIQRAKTFIYSTAPSPFVVGGLLESLQIIQNETWRQKALFANAEAIKQFCQKQGFNLISDQSQIICLQAESNKQVLNWSEFLFEHNIWVSAIRPPTTPTPRLRLTPTALHTPAELEKLFEALQNLKNNL